MSIKTPSIRFKGFTDAWEQRELGELSDIFDGTHQTPNYQNSGIMFLSVENINSLESEKYISVEDFIKNFNIFPIKGDVLMTRIGDVGTASVVESNAPIAYYVSLALLKKKSLDPYFLKESISSQTVKNEIWKRTLHIAFPKKINKNEIGKVLVPYPKKMEEQEQIGMFLKNLDNLINKQQSKVMKLKNVKKAMYEKMFPKNGNSNPEIRFAGFIEAWEQRKLLDSVLKVIDFRGRTPKKLGMDWSEDGYLALSALNVKNGYIDESIDAHYGNQKLYDKWMIGNELHQGQVLFTTEAPMGNVAQVPDNKQYILSQRTIAFEVDEQNFTENYLATVLRSPNIFYKLTALSSGGTAKGVSQKSMTELTIPIPKNTLEQNKIGEYFQQLDNLITLHQRKFEKLKNIKKACLEKMFV